MLIFMEALSDKDNEDLRKFFYLLDPDFFVWNR